MPSVASHVSATIAQHRDAKVPSSASNADDRAEASPFAEMLDNSVTPKDAAPAKDAKAAGQTSAAAQKSGATDTAKDAPSPQAEPAAQGVADVLAAMMTDIAKPIEGAVEPALTPELQTSVPAPQPAESNPPQVDLAAFLETVAAATQPKPQAAQDDRQTPADDAQADDAKPVEASDGEADDQPADAKVAAIPANPVATPVASALPPSQSAEAVPQAADSAIKSAPQIVAAEAAKAAPARPEAGEAQVGKHPQEAVAALPASDAAPEEQKIIDVDPLAAVAANPGKHEAAKAQAPQTAVNKTEMPPQADTASSAETPAAPALDAKPAATPAHHGAAKVREAADAPAKPDTIPDPIATQKGAEPGSAFTLPPQASATAVNATAGVSPQKDGTNPATAIPIEGVAVEIAARALEGKHHFEIRLDPPELGRIHVRLDIDRNGEITSRVMTDRQDTLDLLRRDAPQLERALNDAGLRTAGNGLQFSLRDHGQGQREQTYFADAARVIVKDDNLAAEALPRGYYRPAGAAGGIDIRV